jgi:hypothetical protein
MNLNRTSLLSKQLRKAREVDDAIRQIAFLDVPEQINGVTVKQFTLRHLTILFQIRSPFVFGTVRDFGDIGTFLWVVSPHYLDSSHEEADRTRQRYQAELVLHPRFNRFYREIPRYLKRAFWDAPATIGGGKEIGVCYPAWIIHKLGGYKDDDALMDKPLARLFQYVKCIDAKANPLMPQFNPMRDKVNSRF